jgi:hypothetical protein
MNRRACIHPTLRFSADVLPRLLISFVAHLGTLIGAAQSRFFDGRDVHENILAAAVGLNKSISLRRVLPVAAANLLLSQL